MALVVALAFLALREVSSLRAELRQTGPGARGAAARRAAGPRGLAGGPFAGHPVAARPDRSRPAGPGRSEGARAGAHAAARLRHRRPAPAGGRGGGLQLARGGGGEPPRPQPRPASARPAPPRRRLRRPGRRIRPAPARRPLPPRRQQVDEPGSPRSARDGRERGRSPAAPRSPLSRDLRARVREMAKYLDPERTVSLAVLAVPDAVHAAAPEVHAEGWGEGVLVVPYSLALPFVLTVYRLALRFGAAADQDAPAVAPSRGGRGAAIDRGRGRGPALAGPRAGAERPRRLARPRLRGPRRQRPAAARGRSRTRARRRSAGPRRGFRFRAWRPRRLTPPGLRPYPEPVVPGQRDDVK